MSIMQVESDNFGTLKKATLKEVITFISNDLKGSKHRRTELCG